MAFLFFLIIYVPLLNAWNLSPLLLPNADDFVLNIYGCGGCSLNETNSLIDFMTTNNLAEGLDPCPAINSSPELLDLISTLKYIQFYPGGDFEVSDGDSPSFTSVDLDNLEKLSKKTSVSVGFGEFGYYFHCLHTDDNWLHSIYPSQSDYSRHSHTLSPQGLFGYFSMPKSHAEAYAALSSYVMERKNDYKGYMNAILAGHSHYAEMYAIKWGANIISLEIGENIENTQSKFAFARGSSRRYQKPWSTQVSPWHGASVTTNGETKQVNGIWEGEDAGHGFSFYKRIFLHSWFAGSSFTTAENSYNYFFDVPPSFSPIILGDSSFSTSHNNIIDVTNNGKLSSHGLQALQIRKFMHTYERGTPFIPMVVVIDEYNGYSRIPCNSGASSWGIFTANSQVQETVNISESVCNIQILVDLFENQIFARGNRGLRLETIEDLQLRPTPYGELIDVTLSDSPGLYLSSYPVILLAGCDLNFSRVGENNLTLANNLLIALQTNSETIVLLQDYNFVELEKSDVFVLLKPFINRIHVLAPWINNSTNRNTAISNDELLKISNEYFPLKIEATSLNGTAVNVQYQINQIKAGWMLEILNNDGVTKAINTPEINNSSFTYTIKITCKFAYVKASRLFLDHVEELNKGVDSDNLISIDILPGDIAFVQFLL